MNKIKYSYSLILVLIAILAYCLIGFVFLPTQKVIEGKQYTDFNDNWEVIGANGESLGVYELPYRLDWGENSVITFQKVIPSDLPEESNALMFMNLMSDYDLYIGDNFIRHYDVVGEQIIGNESATEYQFIDLHMADRGQLLRYVCYPGQESFAGMDRIVIGDKTSMYDDIIGSGLPEIFCAAILFVFGFLVVVISYILERRIGKVLPVKFIGTGAAIIAVWMVANSPMRQFVLTSNSTMRDLAYFLAAIIAYPFILFMEHVQAGRYKKGYAVIKTCTLLALFFMWCGYFALGSYLDELFIIPMVNGVCVFLFLVGTIILDKMKGELPSYSWAGACILVFGVFACAQIVWFVIAPTTMNSGVLLVIGLLGAMFVAGRSTILEIVQIDMDKNLAVERSRTKDNFLANMSHEIRTPIGAILGMNEMILREAEQDAVIGYAENVDIAGHKLLSIVNDILDFSKIEAGKMDIVLAGYSMHLFIGDLYNMISEKANGKGLKLIFDIDQNMPDGLLGDEVRIQQILLNLLNNAIKYTEEGSITLKGTFNMLDEDMVELRFAVQDTGYGIKKEDMDKLFSSFERLNSKKTHFIEGTGLGLTISKHLLELMNGSISVTSEYSKGSVFTAVIPQKVLDRKTIAQAREHKSEEKKQTIQKALFFAPEARVLIIDDNNLNLTVFSALLKRTKMQVDIAASGEKGLEMLRKDTYDLVLLDHMMPVMDGIECLEHIKQEKLMEDKPVIVLTANAIKGAREMYIESGFSDYIPKPVRGENLEQTMMKWIPKEKIKFTET